MDSKRSAFGHWFAGLTDGEGSFNIRITLRPGGQRYAIRCSFAIHLRLDDIGTLEDIRDNIGVGDVRRVLRRKEYGNPCAAFRVESIPDNKVIVALFDEFPLRAKKRNDFLIYREAVNLCDEVSTRASLVKWRDVDVAAIVDLRDQLQRGRMFRP